MASTLTDDDYKAIETYLSGKGVDFNNEVSAPEKGDKVPVVRGSEGKYITYQNLVDDLALYNTEDRSWKTILDLINNNKFKDVYANGDAILSTFTDGADVYEYPLIVANNNIDVELADGSILEHRVRLQPLYSTPWDIQFSQYRAFLRCPQGLLAGSYKVTFAQGWGTAPTTLVWYFTITHAVPAGGRLGGFRSFGSNQNDKNVYTHGNDGKLLYTDNTITSTEISGATDLGTMNYATRNGDLNCMQEAFYGWNDYERSAVNQFLESNKKGTGWWVAQDDWDCEPSANTVRNGYLSYLDPNLVNILKAVKVQTAYNNVQGNSGQFMEGYHRAFLPSLEEMYIVNQGAGEGDVLPYWQERSGLDSPATWYTDRSQYSVFPVNNHTSANYIWLRSADRNHSSSAWSVYPSGFVNGYNCRNESRVLPLVTI